MATNQISQKWRRMAEVYTLFVEPDVAALCAFDEPAALEQYRFESGQGGDNPFQRPVPPYNGYAVGKHWMDVTIASWRDDIASGSLFAYELYEDERFPAWWLDRVIGDCRLDSKGRAHLEEAYRRKLSHGTRYGGAHA